MIILKYANLRDPNFLRTLYKLTGHNGFTTKTIATLAGIKKRVDAEMNIAQGEFVHLLKQYAELDESGDFVPEDNKPGTFKIISGKEAEWEKACAGALQKEFVIQKSKITLKEVESAKLSPQEFINLEALFVEVDDKDIFESANTGISGTV